MMLTPEQRAKIFALQREYRMTKDDLYAVVVQVSGGDSISALTKEQGIRLIDRLECLGGGRTQPKPMPRENRATNPMLGKIRALERTLGWHTEPQRLMGFTKKLTGVDNLNWLTKQQAGKLIEGLKRMQDRVHDRYAP